MKARVPLDVDLEDRLVYGLSPLRFGYVVFAGMAAFALWRSGYPGPARAGAALTLAGLGAAFAWGGWRGRPFDGWVVDLALYLRRNHRLELNGSLSDALSGIFPRLLTALALLLVAFPVPAWRRPSLSGARDGRRWGALAAAPVVRLLGLGKLRIRGGS
ncbi:MAG: hypothetical protein ACREPI_01250 [Candidatus Dormibacterales bacterium]